MRVILSGFLQLSPSIKHVALDSRSTLKFSRIQELYSRENGVGGSTATSQSVCLVVACPVRNRKPKSMGRARSGEMGFNPADGVDQSDVLAEIGPLVWVLCTGVFSASKKARYATHNTGAIRNHAHPR